MCHPGRCHMDLSSHSHSPGPLPLLFFPRGGQNPSPTNQPRFRVRASIVLVSARTGLTPVKKQKKQFKTIKTIPIRKEKAIKKEKNRLLLTHSGPGVDKGTQQVRVRWLVSVCCAAPRRQAVDLIGLTRVSIDYRVKKVKKTLSKPRTRRAWQ